MGCSWLRVFPKLSLLVLTLELWQGEGRLWSSPEQLGKVPTIAGALLLHQRLLGTGAASAPPKPTCSRRGCTAEGAGLEREQTCPEVLLVATLLPRSSLRHLCAVLLVLLAPPLPSSGTLGPSLLNFSCGKMKAQRSSPWPGACPCLKSPWGKERKCF